jgi:hypothetical protein
MGLDQELQASDLIGQLPPELAAELQHLFDVPYERDCLLIRQASFPRLMSAMGE